MNKIFLQVFGFAILIVFLIIIGCQKEEVESPINEVVELVEEPVIDLKISHKVNDLLSPIWPDIQKLDIITYNECFDIILKNYSEIKNLCFDGTDLQIFLTEYGQSCIDYVSVANTDVQDYNDTWEFRSYIRNNDSTASPAPNIIPQNVLWNVNGNELLTSGDLTFTQHDTTGFYCSTIECISVDCIGIQPFSVLVTLNDGSQYSRGGIGRFLPFNYPDKFPQCKLTEQIPMSSYDFDCPCPIKFSPYEFLVTSCLESDHNLDGVSNVADLQIILANYCNGNNQ